MKVLYIFLFILLALQFTKECGGEAGSACECAKRSESKCCYYKTQGYCTTLTTGDNIECCNEQYYSNYLCISLLSLIIILLL